MRILAKRSTPGRSSAVLSLLLWVAKPALMATLMVALMRLALHARMVMTGSEMNKPFRGMAVRESVSKVPRCCKPLKTNPFKTLQRKGFYVPPRGSWQMKARKEAPALLRCSCRGWLQLFFQFWFWSSKVASPRRLKRQPNTQRKQRSSSSPTASLELNEFNELLSLVPGSGHQAASLLVAAQILLWSGFPDWVQNLWSEPISVTAAMQ